MRSTSNKIVTVLVITLLVLFNTGKSQQAVVSVIDKKTGDEVPFAHICFESVNSGEQKHTITDIHGQAINPLNEKAIIAVSFVGFETLYDTLLPFTNKVLQLKPTVINMGEIVVTAQYTPQRADKSIYKVKVIGASQISQKGATNLGEILTHELSVRVGQNGVFGSNMSIRGLGGQHVKYLVDGIPVIGRLNGEIDLGDLAVNNVDHIEVIEGPMSVVYGSNALAGVVNIITSENVNVPFKADVNSYVESAGNYNFNATASGSKGNNIFGLAGGRNFFDGYSTNDGSRTMFWKPKRQYTLDGYYVYKTPAYKFKYTSRYFDQLLIDKGEIIEPHFARDTYFNSVRFTNSIDFSTKIGEYRYVKILGAYSIYNRKRNTYFKDLHSLDKVLSANIGDQDTTRFNAVVLRTELSKSTPESNLNYQFGLDINVESGKGVKLNGNKQIGDYAAYLSMKYTPLPQLVIQPGLRYIYNTRYKAPLVYSMNIKWDFNEYYSIRSSYARGFRAPSLKELYLYFVDVNHNVQGNENLEAENSHHVNLSLSYAREQGKTTYGYDADLFYNQIYNSIQLVRVGSSDDLYSYANIFNYKSMGGQLELFYNLYPHFEWKVGISETGRKSLVDENIPEYDKALYSTDVNSSFSYRFNKIKSGLSLFYKYTGELQQFYENNEGEIVTGTVGDYHTLDLTLNKTLLNQAVSLTAGIKNIFDVFTVPSTLSGASGGAHGGGGSSSNIGYGRSYFFKVSYHFNKF
ncbi:MAG: TonB-dependent receptor [Bacteroidales bacterium]|nr:TonB-dependent receptor [Bacteroidales bacterium]MCF8403716.1 TonB-dependent receptor [Bacteroidales bacterium]